MYDIKYGITLNEKGRPCIDLPEDYEHRPEDRFFAIEIARYILQEVYSRKSTELDESTDAVMETTINFLGQIGDEIAEIQYNSMRILGESTMFLKVGFHVNVNSIEERNALPDKDILYNNKLFDRVPGLKVSVQTPLDDGGWHFDYYELVDEITNENWVKI